MNILNDKQEATRFLELLGKDPDKTWIRCLRQWKSKAGTGADTQHLELKPDANAYFITGNGDPANGKNVEDSDIKSCPALFVEWDDRPVAEQLKAWQALGLPEPTVSVCTGGKSIHLYWVLVEPMAPEAWCELIKRLIEHCGADPQNKNPSRLMRLPGSIYYDKKTGEATGTAAKIVSTCARRYSVSEIEACLPPVLAKAAPRAAASNLIAATSSKWEPRSIDEIRAAAEYIPNRIGGEGTYEQDRNALCGCAAALAEAGYPEAIAIELLANKWPTVKHAEQVLKTATTRNAGSYWRIAKEHGYQLNRPRGCSNG